MRYSKIFLMDYSPVFGWSVTHSFVSATSYWITVRWDKDFFLLNMNRWNARICVYVFGFFFRICDSNKSPLPSKKEFVNGFQPFNNFRWSWVRHWLKITHQPTIWFFSLFLLFFSSSKKIETMERKRALHKYILWFNASKILGSTSNVGEIFMDKISGYFSFFLSIRSFS